MPAAHINQKMLSGPLEVELQAVVSAMLVLGIQARRLLPQGAQSVSLQKQSLPRQEAIRAQEAVKCPQGCVQAALGSRISLQRMLVHEPKSF